MVLSLDEFSTELLLKIFKYLEVRDLCRLKQTCKRFNKIIDKWAHSFNINIVPLVTNQLHPEIINRSAGLLSPFERLRISRNWKLGIYKEKKLLASKIKYIPWLQLEKELLWVSRGRNISAYQRNKRGINTKVVEFLQATDCGEVCHFVKYGNLILCGQTDGNLWLKNLDNKNFIFNIRAYHSADINSVDMNDNTIVSGSKDNHVKIRRLSDDSESFSDDIDLRDRVWSVALSSENISSLAIGTAGTLLTDTATVTIYDMSSQTIHTQLQRSIYGAGVLDIKWENPALLWSCGYDSYVRRWDIRTGKCEQALGDPHLATVYCFQYDNVNTIINGTDRHGRVVLWDTRQGRYAQMYFMECCRSSGKSSPVYSLSYDAKLMFTMTDQYVNILDFSPWNGTSRDYSELIFNL